MSDDHDSPWKEALRVYFKDFVALLFLEIHDQIDWSVPPVFLDHELQQVTYDRETGRRSADKLVKVKTSQGHELWVLMHIEIQGYVDSEFAERVYLINSRLYDRYRIDTVSAVVLTDNSPTFYPERFSRGFWGCQLEFRFPIQKLSEWEARWDELSNSRNPFALVVMAQLRARTAKGGVERKEWKTRLIRSMYEHGFSRPDILELFRLIDWFLQLPHDLEQAFLREHYEYEESKKMPYITSAERFGIIRGERTLLYRQLTKKFGPLDAATAEMLESATEADIVRWSENILDATTIAEVFA